MIVRNRIKRLMRERNITTLTQLANMCELSPSTISRLISGARGGSRSTIHVIAKALGTTAEWLMGENVPVSSMELGGITTDENQMALKQKENKFLIPRRLEKVLSPKIHKLRDLVRLEERCRKKVEEAETLSMNIFSESADRITLPNFTKDPIEHFRSVEAYLDEIIFGSKFLMRGDFVPSPEEAMILLAAVWLHDIGMRNPLLVGERSVRGKDLYKLRYEFNNRTSSYILDSWKESSWLPEEKMLLANVCYFCQRGRSLDDFAPPEESSTFDGRIIHGKILAALLRLADGCHARRFRPIHIPRIISQTEKAVNFISPLEDIKIVSSISFDHKRREIRLRANIPPVFDFGLGKFDLGKLLECMRSNIEEDLKSVQATLVDYRNVSFLKVVCQVNRSAALSVQNAEKCLSVWPYLLNLPCSSTELCGALAQTLLFLLEKSESFGDREREKVDYIVSKVSSLNNMDGGIENLKLQIKQILLESPSKICRKKLKEYLELYLHDTKDRLKAVVAETKKIVRQDAALILYGYSKVVIEFLKKIQGTNQPVYVVSCNTPIDNLPVDPEEDEKLKEVVRALGLKEHFCGLSNIILMFNELRQEVPYLLLGTHGILKNGDGDLLCRMGTYMLVSTAKSFGAKVAILTTSDKFSHKKEVDLEMPWKTKSFSPRFPATYVEKIPRNKGLIDMVITENGPEYSTESFENSV